MAPITRKRKCTLWNTLNFQNYCAVSDSLSVIRKNKSWSGRHWLVTKGKRNICTYFSRCFVVGLWGLQLESPSFLHCLCFMAFVHWLPHKLLTKYSLFLAHTSHFAGWSKWCIIHCPVCSLVQELCLSMYPSTWLLFFCPLFYLIFPFLQLSVSCVSNLL